MKAFCSAILHGWPEVLFLQGTCLNLVLLALTFLRPNVGLAGIIAVSAAYASARLIHVADLCHRHGFYLYNPWLVGLSLGYYFRLTGPTIVLVALAGSFTLFLCLAMSYLWRTYLNLPVLSLPFVLVSAAAYLASIHYTALPPATLAMPILVPADLPLPFWVSGLLRSLGAIVFVPSDLAGLIVAWLLLLHSRILLLLAVLGYYAGVLLRALLIGSMDQAFGEINSFNFILIAMSVGASFLVPSIKSYLLAILGVMLSTVVMDAMTVLTSPLGLSPCALPFNIVVLGMVYALGVAGYPGIVVCPAATPEETLENELVNRLRYQVGKCELSLPFSGVWTVWQGFDGQWTHQGNWRHAYDFVITDETEKTHRGEGTQLRDYYCWRKPVLAPVQGQIVRVINHLPDCPIGLTDHSKNWGNLVVLRDDRGYFIELSHFAADSIPVKEGDFVTRGTVLGLCGNSGYSPQPHIHVQVQVAERVGAATLPFCFSGYREGDGYHATGLPGEGVQVEPIWPDSFLDAITTFNLDDTEQYDILQHDRTIRRLTVTVRMAPDGTFYFESGRGKLYFGKDSAAFYFYRLEGDDPGLRLLFAALPRLPLAYRDRLQWHDYLPVGVATDGVRRMLARFGSSFYPPLARIGAKQTFRSRYIIESELDAPLLRLQQQARVELDRRRGFASVRVGDLELRRTG